MRYGGRPVARSGARTGRDASVLHLKLRSRPTPGEPPHPTRCRKRRVQPKACGGVSAAPGMVGPTEAIAKRGRIGMSVSNARIGTRFGAIVRTAERRADTIDRAIRDVRASKSSARNEKNTLLDRMVPTGVINSPIPTRLLPSSLHSNSNSSKTRNRPDLGPTTPAKFDYQRVDKWLWHARMVRTRADAAALAQAGRVRINGNRMTLAAHPVRIGDVLTVALDRSVRVVEVAGFCEKRGGAPVARLLYRDLTESGLGAARCRADSLTGARRRD